MFDAMIYRGGGVVAIATINKGNKKTGQVVGLTVAPESTWQEMQAFKGGTLARGAAYTRSVKPQIETVCGSCPFIATGKCYVQHNPHTAAQPAANLARTLDACEGFDADAWRLTLRLAKRYRIDRVRSAVAGDLAALPPEVALAMLETAKRRGFKMLGYTHEAQAVHLQSTHMLSVHSEAEARRAIALGWRVFLVGDPLATQVPAGFMLCPSSTESITLRGHGLPCHACGACDGARRENDRRSSVYTPRHASGDTSRKRAAKKRNGNVAIEMLSASRRVVGLIG
jgi:hypothetical protein